MFWRLDVQLERASIGFCQQRAGTPPIQLTISRETYDRLGRVQDLLRYAVPNGNLETILERADASVGTRGAHKSRTQRLVR
jgi:hypothetical protein